VDGEIVAAGDEGLCCPCSSEPEIASQVDARWAHQTDGPPSLTWQLEDEQGFEDFAATFFDFQRTESRALLMHISFDGIKRYFGGFSKL